MNPFDTLNQFDALAAFSQHVQNFIAQIPLEQKLAAQGIVVLDEYDFSSCNPIKSSDFPDTHRILAAIAATGNLWTLKRTEAKNDTTNQRTEIFRMTQKNTFCDFVLSGKVSHVVMFKTGKEDGWTGRRCFKNFFETMMEAGCESVKGDALTNTQKNPLGGKLF